MFQLASRLARVEALAWGDLLLAPSEPNRSVLGLTVEALGEARILSSSGLDHLLVNRVIGLSGDEPIRIRRAIRHFEERGIERFMVHLGPEAEAPEIQALLRSLGVERYRRPWDQFVRPTMDPPEIPTGFRMRRATRGDASRVAEIVANAFDAPGSEPLFAAVIDRPRWSVFVATDEGDRPLAAGGLFVDDGLGYLAFAATVPAHRGRGAQRMLMAHRIHEALRLGCAWVGTETGAPLGDEPNPSRENMIRSGFRAILRRDNYVPIGTRW